MDSASTHRAALASIPWPDHRQRLQEQVRLALSMTPDQRFQRVDELTRLCLHLAAAAGNLQAAHRYRDHRHAQWRQSIRQVIRQYEQRQLRQS